MFGHGKFRSDFPESSIAPSKREKERKGAGARRPGASVCASPGSPPAPRGHTAAPGDQPASRVSPLYSRTQTFPGLPAGGPGGGGGRSQCSGGSLPAVRGAPRGCDCHPRLQPCPRAFTLSDGAGGARARESRKTSSGGGKVSSWGGIIFFPPYERVSPLFVLGDAHFTTATPPRAASTHSRGDGEGARTRVGISGGAAAVTRRGPAELRARLRFPLRVRLRLRGSAAPSRAGPRRGRAGRGRSGHRDGAEPAGRARVRAPPLRD